MTKILVGENGIITKEIDVGGINYHFRITAVLGALMLATGERIRSQKESSISLSTEDGVIKWIREQSPLVSLKVMDGMTDVTSKFKQYARFVENGQATVYYQGWK